MCIFCKIVQKEIPADIVYEDGDFLAFLDINPVTPGHTLLIPKVHYPLMTDVPDRQLGLIYAKAKELMSHLKERLGADSIILSVFGEDVAHFHIHLIPRHYGSGLANFWPTKKYGDGEAEAILNIIKIS